MSYGDVPSRGHPLREVTRCLLRGGGSIFGPFKYHWWELHLECGHTVERRIRWLRIDNPPRGFAAMHRGVSLDRLPPEPRRARCNVCPSDHARQQEHCTHPNRAFTIGGPEDSDGYVWCPDCRTNLTAEAEDDARQQGAT